MADVLFAMTTLSIAAAIIVVLAADTMDLFVLTPMFLGVVCGVQIGFARRRCILVVKYALAGLGAIWLLHLFVFFGTLPMTM